MKKIGIVVFLFCCMSLQVLCQEQNFTVKGTVKEKNTENPIRDVEIMVLGKEMVRTDAFGDFRIKVKRGDELIISHDSFNTVYYTIMDNQKIDILVEDHPKSPKKRKSIKSKRISGYEDNLKKAKDAIPKNAATSIEYVTKALEAIPEDDPASDQKKSVLFETLADVYRYWKQPDLAESYYSISLSNQYNTDVKIKLGNSQLENSEYKKALNSFNELLKSQLDKLQKIKTYEGLGDCYKALSNYKNAAKNYNKALSLSQQIKLNDKVIILNSKLAEVLQNQGSLADAVGYLDESVRLADQTNKKVAAKQRVKAADFYGRSNSYAKEIQLRKEAIENIADIEEEIEENEDSGDMELPPESPLTSQVQNYKIANAFAAQKSYDQAIPYLEESIKEATSKNDLVVQKDATRKLGELYREKGELKKASDAFKEYEVIIDKLYIQKEQEISQANRFSRELAQKANRIATLEKDRALNESRYKLALTSQELVSQQSVQQRIVIYFLIGLTVLLLLAAYLMFRNIKQQRYANNTLALKSLRSQMNPHFIFNALNSVNTFIATNDERAANKYLTDFSLLMRAVLENSEEDFIPLQKEVELLELYVQLEHFRFQDKFDYTIEVDPDIDVGAYVIPPMLLQPYVENAVWHGLRYRTEKGLLSIGFNKLTEGSIAIVIADNGIGRRNSKALKTENQKKQKSQGMSNIKKRVAILNEMYRDQVDVVVSDLDDNMEGTKVKLILKKLK